MILRRQQMGDKYVLNKLLRVAHGNDIAQTAGSKIKEETVAITQLDHDAGTCLVNARGKGGAAHE